MKQIKFSHHYYKLGGIKNYDVANLLDVFKVNLEDLSPFMRGYDTKYPTKGKIGYYPLPRRGIYLLLIFKKKGRIPFLFTTIRRWTPQKEKYYRGAIGEEFKVVIGDE